jgi:hypothetical protein
VFLVDLLNSGVGVELRGQGWSVQSLLQCHFCLGFRIFSEHGAKFAKQLSRSTKTMRHKLLENMSGWHVAAVLKGIKKFGESLQLLVKPDFSAPLQLPHPLFVPSARVSFNAQLTLP